MLTSKEQLPTTEQWSNVGLTNTIRNITDETGTIKKSKFSYAGYAARLLTYQEVNNGCYDGSTNIGVARGLSTKCKYLMENTKYSSSSLKTYGGWLETLGASHSNYAWFVTGNSRGIFNRSVQNSSDIGVRPAIEVAKTDIEY